MNAAQNGSNSRERRHFSPQHKVTIVKAHLVDGLSIVSFRQGCVSRFGGLAIVAVFLSMENGHGWKEAS